MDGSYNGKYTEEVLRRSDENLVFLDSDVNGQLYLDAGLLKPIREEARALAPGFADRFVLNDDKILSDYIVGMGMRTDLLLRTAVLMKTEVYNTYGMDVRSAADYVDLLRLLKEENPEQIPAAASPVLYERMYGYSPIWALYLPEIGQYPLRQLFHRDNIRGEFLYDSGSNTLIPTHESEQFASSVRAFHSLCAEGLVELWSARHKPADFGSFPTLLVNTRDFINRNMQDAVPEYNRLNMAEYRINILYGDTEPIASSAGGAAYTVFAYAMRNADTALFLRWMEWLEDKSNYRLFLDGLEGTDYQTDGDSVVYLETALGYNLWDQRSFFVRSYLEDAYPANIPSNFIEEVESIAVYNLPLPPEAVHDAFYDEDRAFDLDPVIQKNREDYVGFVEGLSSHAADTLDLYIETFTTAQNDSEEVKTLLEVFDPVNNPPVY